MDLAELWIKIQCDTIDLNDAMVKAEKQAQDSFGKISKAVGVAMLAVGAAITATAALSVKNFASMAHEVELLSMKTGFSAKTLSELKYAADLTGTSIGGLAVGIKRMQVVMTEASSGSKQAIEDLNRIGLKYSELAGLKPEDQFKKVLVALSNISDPAARAAAAVALFGRSGTDLIPMLANGEQGLKDFAQAAADAGVVLDESTMKIGADAQEAFEKLGKSVEGVKNTIALALIPVIKPVIDGIAKVIQSITVWMKEHEGLGASIVKVATAIGILLTVFGTVLIFIPKLVAGWKLLTVGWQLLSGALMSNPIGLVITAIAALITIGILLWKNWDHVVKFFKDAWDQIKIAFAHGVRFIVNTILLPFVEIIGKSLGAITWLIGKVVGLFNKGAGQAINEVSNKMLHARQEITAWTDRLETSTRASMASRDTASETATAIDDVGTAAEDTAASMEDLAQSYVILNDKYGLFTSATAAAVQGSKELGDAVDQVRDIIKSALNDEKSAIQDRYDTEIKAIREAAKARVAPITSKIKSIQEDLDKDAEAKRIADNAMAKSELQTKIDTLAKRRRLTNDEYKEFISLQAEMKKLIADQAAEDIRLNKEAEIEKLNDSIDAINTQADLDVIAKESTRDNEIAAIDLVLITFTNAEKEKTRLLIEELALRNTAVSDFLAGLSKEALPPDLAKEITGILDTVEKRDVIVNASNAVAEAERIIAENQASAEIKLETGAISAGNVYPSGSNTIDALIKESYEEKASSIEANNEIAKLALEAQAAINYANAVFNADIETKLIGSYASGTSYVPETGIALLHKGEAVIPDGESVGGAININFNETVFMDNEETIRKLADKVYTQIKRTDRLNYGR